MKGNIAALSFVVFLLRFCGPVSAQAGSVSATAMSSSDDKMRIAVLEKEVQDLKDFTRLLLEQTKIYEDKMTVFEEKLIVLETRNLTETDGFGKQISEVEEALKKHTFSLDKITMLLDKTTVSQHLVESTVTNHMTAIATNKQALTNLEKNDSVFELKLNTLRSSLGASIRRLVEQRLKLSKKQDDMEKQLELKIRTLDDLNKSLSGITTKLQRDVLSLQTRQKQVAEQIRKQSKAIQRYETAQKTTVQKTNVQDIVWRRHTDMDSGVIEYFNFNKTSSTSSLRVSYYGNIRQASAEKCSRWYFKFNGAECSNPDKIEAVFYKKHSYWSHMPSVVSGVCHSIPVGNVRIAFLVGACSSRVKSGDAYTGWGSVSRITVEEF